MTEKTTVGYVKVEQPFGMDPPKVCCPICGQKVVGEEGSDPCVHLEFVYPGVLGEFYYKSDGFEKAFSGEIEDDLDCENFAERLAAAGYNNSLLAIEVTYGGMACGPVWYTDVFGFNYANGLEEKAK